ncbi:MAG: toxin-antitoxin system HicB family antitoxin, partial [Armatimonadota bacterium]
MRPFRYRIVVEWSDEDGVFVARVPALPGCAAHGKTTDEAAREARRAAEAMLAVLREDGDPPPPEDITTGYSGQIRLRLARSLHERLARLAAAEGVSLNQIMVTLLAEGTGMRGAVTQTRARARNRGHGQTSTRFGG